MYEVQSTCPDVPSTRKEGKVDFWRVNVAPYIENRKVELMEYLPEYSTSKLEEGRNVEKYEMREFTIINPSRAAGEIRRKIVKVWEKLGYKVAVFSTLTGENRIYHSRRLPNGWKELDAVNDFVTVYDELYGKGAYDKDVVILDNYWKRTDTYLLQKNNTLSSK